MQPIEPKFDYLSAKANANSYVDAVQVVDDKKEHQNEQSNAQKAQKKAKAKTGSSLGWGWFQGFAVFIVGILLSGLCVFVFLMAKDDPLRGGAPKYILSRNGIAGAVELNPLWEKEGASSTKTAVDPLAASTAKQNVNTNIKLPSIELLSDTDASSPATELQEKSETAANAAVDKQVSGLLDSANDALQALKLMTPKGESAYDYYRKALALDANNAIAKAGIHSIVLKYLDLAQEKKDQNDLEKAIIYINNALVIEPKNEELLDFKQDLEYWIKGDNNINN